MIMYIENPIDSIEKLLGLRSECSKIFGIQVNTPKSIVFIYINNKKLENRTSNMSFVIKTEKINLIKMCKKAREKI